MRKFTTLKFILLFILSLAAAGKTFAQADSGLTLFDSLEKAFEDSMRTTRTNPGVSYSDSSLQKFSIERSERYYQRWSDQFPSYFIMRFNGLPAENPVQLPVKNEYDDLKFWWSLFLLAFLALIRFSYAKDFEELKQTFRNWGLNQQMIRELGVGVPLGTVLLNIFSSLVISFYVFLLVEHFKAVLIQPAWLLMLFCIVFVCVALLLRYFLLKTAEFILPFTKELKLFNYYEIQLNRITGIYLFPLLLLIAFSPPPVNLLAIYLSFTVAAVMLVVRYIKGFSIGISYFGSHIIHFLLYICALEIAPVFIIIRLLLNLDSVRFAL
ncbi:MAG: DUF4271 domain-containing protein [Chitinophagales bacterium]